MRARYHLQGDKAARSLLVAKPDLNPMSMLKILHDRAHAPSDDIRMLLQRAGMWERSMRSQLEKMRSQCIVCARAAEPKKSRKHPQC